MRFVPVAEGLRTAAEVIRSSGWPVIALCACELRSPAQIPDDAFRNFNRSYVAMLAGYGLIGSGGANPVARDHRASR